MKQFLSVNDVTDLDELIAEALALKEAPYADQLLGKNKTLGLVFMNPSLRTRMSTQKAAMNLGMNVIVMNMDKEGWALEFNDGAIMNGSTVEHIRDAGAVMGQYCDVIGVRCFPTLKNREEDYNENVLHGFVKHSQVPVISLESATLHPLQSFADLITISENINTKPKVVLAWAPHVKALPQAVANSFSSWMCNANIDFTITHPESFELAKQFTSGAVIEYNQEKALRDADFVYVKNWSSYRHYGEVKSNGENWLLNAAKMKVTNNAKIMHCLPVRRNVELMDELIDGQDSLILKQALNRVYAAQTILKRMINNL